MNNIQRLFLFVVRKISKIAFDARIRLVRIGETDNNLRVSKMKIMHAARRASTKHFPYACGKKV